MSFLLAASRIYLPWFIRKSRLNELFIATADAFQREKPEITGYSLNQCLTRYALFTAKNAEESILNGNEYEVRERLYRNALQIGKDIRKELKIKTLKEVMQACKVVYKALKIEFLGDLQGRISIPSCFFSSYYSSHVCRVISGLDKGLIAGLSGGLKMEFTQRITEGNQCCIAHLPGAEGTL
jgi:hypothetical protein